MYPLCLNLVNKYYNVSTETIVTCVLYNIKISFYNQFWIWISIRSTPCNWTADDPIFALLHLFFTKNALIFNTYVLQLIVLILLKIILSIRNNFYWLWTCFPKNFGLYPLSVHCIMKVQDSILYQKFALWTYSPFWHEVSLLYYSQNNLLRVLTYVCRHCNINIFNLNKHFFFFVNVKRSGHLRRR